MESRKPYPTDISHEEWAFVAPYLTLMTPDAPQREYSLREVFGATRWIVGAGAPWRHLPNNAPCSRRGRAVLVPATMATSASGDRRTVSQRVHSG